MVFENDEKNEAGCDVENRSVVCFLECGFMAAADRFSSDRGPGSLRRRLSRRADAQSAKPDAEPQKQQDRIKVAFDDA
jgi:hypothetical protein